MVLVDSADAFFPVSKIIMPVCAFLGQRDISTGPKRPAWPENCLGWEKKEITRLTRVENGGILVLVEVVQI